MTLRVQIIAAATTILLAAAILLFGPAAWNRIRSMAAEARLSASQGNAAHDSAKDAIGAVGASGAAERASEDLTRSNEKDIRNAKGADAPVDPDVRDAGLASLCRRAAYRDSAKCRVQQPDPQRVGKGR